MKYYTHSGFFHADEAFGFAITEMAGVCDEVVRLISLENIPDDGIVADIGREWNPKNNRFDHHQGLFRRHEETGVPLASAGMLWGEFGYYAVFNTLGGEETEERSLFFHDVVARVDQTLIEGIDAHDADSQYSCKAICMAGDVRVTTISNAISMLNTDDPSDHDSQIIMFYVAARFAKTLLESAIRSAAKFIESKSKFNDIAHVDGSVITLSEGLPWKEIVHEMYPDAIFVISPSNHPGNPWAMIAVPIEPESREVKKQIERPEWFKGFIHQGKWIAGGNSAGELAELALFNLEVVAKTDPLDPNPEKQK